MFEEGRTCRLTHYANTHLVYAMGLRGENRPKGTATPEQRAVASWAVRVVLGGRQ